MIFEAGRLIRGFVPSKRHQTKRPMRGIGRGKAMTPTEEILARCYERESTNERDTRTRLLDDRREPEEIAGDPRVIQALWLVRNGVPFDVAWSLPLTQANAWTEILYKLECGASED